jgi:hypothetical protein
VNTNEAFKKWLEEPMVGSSETRKEFAENRGTNLEHLRWAFGGGWVLGQRQAVKDLQNV